MFEIEISCRCAILVCRSSWLCRRHEVGSLKTVIKTYKERMCHLRERCTHHADHTHHTSYTCPRTRIYIISVNSFMQPSSNFPNFFLGNVSVCHLSVCVCANKSGEDRERKPEGNLTLNEGIWKETRRKLRKELDIYPVFRVMILRCAWPQIILETKT